MANPNFPTNPGYNIYVGARYVPIFSGEWDATKRYENLEIVSYQGVQYTSRSYVPVGVPPTDETYWVKSSDFNPEFDALEKRVENHEGRITQNEENIKALQDSAGAAPDVDQLKQDVAALQTSQETQDTEIENLETAQGRLSTQISTLETELNNTQTAQDTKITALETSQTAQDTKIAALETSQTAQGTKITALETSQTAQDAKIAALETSQTAQDAKIAALETSQASQDDEIAELKEENTAQQVSIDALKAASGDLPTELEKLFAKDREHDAALESLNGAQTEVQNQLSALKNGSVELPYVKNANGSVKGHIAYMNNPDTGDAVVGGRVEGTADSLRLYGGGPELPTHVTIGAGQVSFDKPISVNGVVSHEDATDDTQSATLGQVRTIAAGASGSAAEALAKANEAKQAADAAQNTADSANTAAQTAQRAANAANTAAEAAQTTANAANTAAGAAQTTANAANTAAGAAQTTANQAVANQANYLPLSGDAVMIGPIRLSKTNDNELIFSQHGDQSISRLFFWRNPENSDIVFGSNGQSVNVGPQITIAGVADPLFENDVANKHYVDSQVAAVNSTSWSNVTSYITLKVNWNGTEANATGVSCYQMKLDDMRFAYMLSGDYNYPSGWTTNSVANWTVNINGTLVKCCNASMVGLRTPQNGAFCQFSELGYSGASTGFSFRGTGSITSAGVHFSANFVGGAIIY